MEWGWYRGSDSYAGVGVAHRECRRQSKLPDAFASSTSALWLEYDRWISSQIRLDRVALVVCAQCFSRDWLAIEKNYLDSDINANFVWRSRELEGQARNDGLIYLAKCWVYKRRHPGGQNGDPG